MNYKHDLIDKIIFWFCTHAATAIFAILFYKKFFKMLCL